jgi:hypothetical protein
LAFTGIDPSTLKEGDQFTELNGVPVCNKFITKATINAMRSKGVLRRENLAFHKHVDTAQLKHEIDSIPQGSVIYITEKLHGTSGRFGYVVDENELPQKWWEKLLKRQKKSVAEYKHLLGTRNTILADHQAEGFYGSEEFRWNAVARLEGNLHKGEVLYFELVGYTTSGQPIMSPQQVTDLKKDLKDYSSPMTYKYGQPEGTCGLYVYRITRVNEDGDAVELAWPQVKQRCSELGVDHVPDLQGAMVMCGDPVIDRCPPYEAFDAEYLRWTASALEEGPSTLDSSHIREGVCIRVEQPDGSTRFLKSKSFHFGVLEGYLKNSDDYVDTEEAA